jgi:hypothetical protein
VAERRLNTTFAHEGGHGLLHAYLFALEQDGVASLFENTVDPRAPKILCRDEHVASAATSGPGCPRRYGGRWWELQANMAIGPLLLPKKLVLVALESHLEEQGSMGRKTLPRAKRATAARALADVFDVNPVVAEIRLAEMFPPSESAQLTL